MNDERKAKRVFIVLSVICAVFPGLVFLVYLLKIAGGLFGQHQTLYKFQEFHQDIYYVILLGFSTIVPPLIAYLCYDEARHAKSGDPANGGGGAPLISQDSLTRERNIFLGGFGALIGLNLLLQLMFGFSIGLLLGVDSGLAFNAVVVLIAKAASVYFVFRLSRFLRQPVWLTILYCMLMPFAVLYLIPFVGLLIAVRRSRCSLEPTKPSFPEIHPVFQLLGVVAFAAVVVVVLNSVWERGNKSIKTAGTHSQPYSSAIPNKPEMARNVSTSPNVDVAQDRNRSIPKDRVEVAGTNQIDLKMWSPLISDAEGGNLDSLRRRFENSRTITEREWAVALMRSAANGHSDVVKFLLSGRNTNVNIADQYGRTALMLAAGNGKYFVTEVLLNHHAQVNARDSSGSSALRYANQYGYAETAALLIGYGAVE